MRDLAKLINEDLNWYLRKHTSIGPEMRRIADQWTYGAPECRPHLWIKAQEVIFSYLGSMSAWDADDSLFLLHWRDAK